mgnify:FL=1
MIVDLLIVFYIFLLFPLIFECEKLHSDGFKVLLVGLFLTPIAGYIYLYQVKRKELKEDSSEQHT